jgi:hypothetical protein
MAELREVFEMTTKQVEPDLDSWRDQERRQGRGRQRRRLGALAVAAAIGVAAIVLVLVTRPGETAPAPPGNDGPAVYPVDPGAVDVATGFVEAYGSFDATKAISYLADGADVSVVGGAGGVGTAQEDWPLNLSWWKATGYQQLLDECVATGSSAAGTYVRCTLDYYGLRADQIGRGPFSGSFWDLTVRDGQIVSGDQYCEIARFSPQMWEPFATWVSETYPKDAAVMYTDSLSEFRLTQKSIRLWEQHTKEYVKAVNQGTAK